MGNTKMTKASKQVWPQKPDRAKTTTIRRSGWAMIGARIAAVLLVGFFSITSHLSAQNSDGTIVGTVVDQTGAVVADAPVKVTNTATSVVSATRTTSVGDYTAINLVPGPYVVSVEMPGFNKTLTDTVNLTANQTLRANLTLHPGSVSQTVKVSATETLLDTDSSTVSSEISSAQVHDVPLASRNFMELLDLSPGTITGPPQPSGVQSFWDDANSSFTTPLSGGSAFVGGGRASSNAYMIDGIENEDPTYETPSINMPLDNIQDVRLLTKDYSAEFGGAASIVNVATKSGTNTFHGTAYDFLQNDDLDANTYTFGAPATKPKVRYNQFGYSFGGPIWIPKIVNLRSKLFFFTDYEGLRYPSKSTQFGYFPTTAELGGDFSASPNIIYNPATGMPFPGNKITNIDPVAQKVLKLGFFATPNIPLTPGGANTEATLAFPDSVDEWSIRGDYKITANDSLFARYSQSAQNITYPSVSPLLGETTKPYAKNVAIDYTHIFSASVVNDLRIGMDRPFVEELGINTGQNIAAQLFTGTAASPLFYGAPFFSFGSSSYYGVGSPANVPIANNWTIYSLGDNVTIIKGAHTLELGVAFRHALYTPVSTNGPNGKLDFNGEYTAGTSYPGGSGSGDAFADFLLGLADNATITTGGSESWLNSLGYAMFAQDGWKLNNKLTLNLGLRYEYHAPFSEEHNRFTEWNQLTDTVMTPNAAIVAQVNSPLLVLDPSNQFSLPDRLNIGPRVGFSYRPFGKNVVRGGYGIFYDAFEEGESVLNILNPPYVASYGATGTVSAPLSIDHLFPVTQGAGLSAVSQGAFILTLDPNRFKTPYVQQWNLGIEHELPRNSVVEVSYMGSSSTHLIERWSPTQGILSNPGPNATVTFLYPNFAILMDSAWGSANYNAGMVRFEKKFDRGYSLLAHYTWAHALGTYSGMNGIGSSPGSPQNPWNVRADYSNLAFDVTNNLVVQGAWELPFGHGKALANNVPYAANLLISGWQFNGIWQAQGGFPYVIYAPSGDNSGTAGASSVARAQLTGQSLKGQNGLAFNPGAFTEPAKGTFGNSSNGVLRGNGFDNVDFSMFKNTYLLEDLNFQLRVEAFNVDNHRETGFWPNTSLTSSGVGRYGSVDHAPRIIQVAGKIIF